MKNIGNYLEINNINYELIIKFLITGGLGLIILFSIIIPSITYIMKIILESIMILLTLFIGLIAIGTIIILLQISNIITITTTINIIIKIININILIEKLLRNILNMNEKIFFTDGYIKIIQYLSNLSEKNINFINILNLMEYSPDKAKKILIKNKKKLKICNEGIIFYYKLLILSLGNETYNDNIDISIENEIINKHC